MENHTFFSEFLLLGFSISPKVQIVLFVLFLTIYTVALVGNALILLVICIDSQLHTPMYFFLCHLSIVDICYASNNVPHILRNFLVLRKTISLVGCGTQMYLYMALGHTECMLLAVMSYDRFVAICHPLRYSVIMNWRVCSVLVIASWDCGSLLAAVHVILAWLLPFCGAREVVHFFCEILAVLKLACADITVNKLVIFAACVIILLLPFTLILISYLHILAAILRISSTEGQRKTFSTCSSHLTVVGLFYGAAMFVYMVPGTGNSTLQQKILSLFYSLVNPTLNPLIYSLRNKQVKGALVKMKRSLGERERFS
ncbi:olfactory receptor 2A1/2A42-like [Alligator sinensis]|uniref:Olfactory receptor n=1 Tax=Alligator sinensis TaxID=38654 RepID=A0A1U7SAH5_ALLSI|nr:olfactory receptor 2A1/2A42-like [Alligator sinensis]